MPWGQVSAFNPSKRPKRGRPSWLVTITNGSSFGGKRVPSATRGGLVSSPITIQAGFKSSYSVMARRQVCFPTSQAESSIWGPWSRRFNRAADSSDIIGARVVACGVT